MDSEENGFLHVAVEGAPASHYLVCLVPGAGNLILYNAFFFFFTFCWFGEQAFHVKRTEAEHAALSQSSNGSGGHRLDWLIGKEYKSERTCDRD